MGFKLKDAPYDKSNMNIAVYKKDLTDGSIGKSNHTGIIVQSGISPEEEQHVIAHEKVHQEQQAKGELDYDKENFYWKGKTYPREKLNEHNEELPWEKEAYKASEKSRNKESKDMGSTKFKLNGHRGNSKPFSQMTDRGLIGASMDDTSGYNQPDYGSSMYNDGASAEMCGPGGGDECDAFSNKGKPKKIKPPKTKVSKDSKYKLSKSQVDLEKTTKGTNVQEVGITGKSNVIKDKGGKGAGIPSDPGTGTTPSSKSGQTKAEFIANKGDKGNKEMAGRMFDKHQKDDKTVTTAKIENYKRNKVDKKGNETFNRGVKKTTTTGPDGKKARNGVTDLTVSKKKLIGKGIKTKSYSTSDYGGKKQSGVKTISKDKLQNKATKATKKIRGYKKRDTKLLKKNGRDQYLTGDKSKTRKGKKTSRGLGVIEAGDRSTGNSMLR